MVARHKRILIALALFFALLFACGIGVYRYLDSVDWWIPTVDAVALQTQAQREQPVGADETATIAFLRTLGFADEHILIEHGSATSVFPGRLMSIQGWIPQPRCCLQPRQIRALCLFDDDERLKDCTIRRGAPLSLSPAGSLFQQTPAQTP